MGKNKPTKSAELEIPDRPNEQSKKSKLRKSAEWGIQEKQANKNLHEGKCKINRAGNPRKASQRNQRNRRSLKSKLAKSTEREILDKQAGEINGTGHPRQANQPREVAERGIHCKYKHRNGKCIQTQLEQIHYVWSDVVQLFVCLCLYTCLCRIICLFVFVSVFCLCAFPVLFRLVHVSVFVKTMVLVFFGHNYKPFCRLWPLKPHGLTFQWQRNSYAFWK